MKDFLLETIVDNDLTRRAKPFCKVKNPFKHFPNISLSLVRSDSLFSFPNKLFIEHAGLTFMIGVDFVEADGLIEPANKSIDDAICFMILLLMR